MVVAQSTRGGVGVTSEIVGCDVGGFTAPKERVFEALERGSGADVGCGV